MSVSALGFSLTLLAIMGDESKTCTRMFYDFLMSVDGEGIRDKAYILRAADVLIANEVCLVLHMSGCHCLF